MKFIDSEHKEFVTNKFKELEQNNKLDVYYKSLIYVLGICPMTRKNFNDIFNIRKGMININCLGEAWQTGSSVKVTRMAFSLWNGCMFDSEDDCENGIKSSYYNPNEIFCCSYAAYFWEGIKIRYPEYSQDLNNNIKIKHIENIDDTEEDFEEI